MKSVRWLAFLMTMLLIVIGSLEAQDTSATFCGNLSAADCELLQNSATVTQDIESTTFNLEGEIVVTNIPEFPLEALSLHWTGTGSYAADTSAFVDMQSRMAELEGDDFFTLMADLLRAMKADMALTIELPQDLRDLMTGVAETIPPTLTFEIRMVDGVAYINLSELAPIATEGSIPTDWIGVDVAELYGEVLPQLYDETMTAFDMTNMMTTFMNPDTLAQFVMLERLPNSEVMGQEMAVFETRIDYVALLDVPAFRDMIMSSIPETEDVETEELLDVIRSMYEGMSVVITQSIGLEDSLIHETVFHLAWDLTSFGEAVELDEMPVIDFDFTVTQVAFNEDFEVVVPENVMLLPLQQMLPLPE